ncbi:Pilus assembly protein, PilO [bacterium BMS3Abin07]|nr:Pilus assembly protein, PilO [bacterium BMS3Abin07]GBE32846.1 Pilus assembly protein, PilO [bacterium BMS3Bbin05]HDO22279.1 hypothetical protein [Nitrospirota bacterium]HDZ88572.1 hypothetical protein [Nitrospirota bacterium]
MAQKTKINIQNLPPAARIAIALVPVIIIIAVFFFLFYKPKTAQINKLKSEIVAQEKEIAKDQAMVEKLPELKKRYAELEYSLKVLSMQLPEESAVSDLLKQISDYGVESGLTITLWKPGAKAKHPSGIVNVIPVSVKMVGTYHKLGNFFSILSGMERIVNIKRIKLARLSARDKFNNLKISFNVQTFSAIPTKPAK